MIDIYTYLDWLEEKVIRPEDNRYQKLLYFLYKTEFFAVLDRDNNRLADAKLLRHRYFLETGDDTPEVTDAPVTVLETLIALAVSCEEKIMYDSAYGDRTAQWFWSMITNMGLGLYFDERWDTNPNAIEDSVSSIITSFVLRRYQKNGYGGCPFMTKDPEKDLREIELWYQLNYWLIEEGY